MKLNNGKKKRKEQNRNYLDKFRRANIPNLVSLPNLIFLSFIVVLGLSLDGIVHLSRSTFLVFTILEFLGFFASTLIPLILSVQPVRQLMLLVGLSSAPFIVLSLNAIISGALFIDFSSSSSSSSSSITSHYSLLMIPTYLVTLICGFATAALLVHLFRGETRAQVDLSWLCSVFYVSLFLMTLFGSLALDRGNHYYWLPATLLGVVLVLMLVLHSVSFGPLIEFICTRQVSNPFVELNSDSWPILSLPLSIFGILSCKAADTWDLDFWAAFIPIYILLFLLICVSSGFLFPLFCYNQFSRIRVRTRDILQRTLLPLHESEINIQENRFWQYQIQYYGFLVIDFRNLVKTLDQYSTRYTAAERKNPNLIRSLVYHALVGRGGNQN
eukprot:gb/GECH01008123.1/.p1 GENE.gb/GECH01008123.1/~~gb/GECH01008123.1/.p1  ORF type:complete len:385 (+),score=38.76 gb/GECH01008123.1/:1-1155(+)